MNSTIMYCGAWDFKGEIKGLKAFVWDARAAQWKEKGTFGQMTGQSILALAGSCLVSVCELGQGGHVVSYEIREDGSLAEKDVLSFSSAKLSYVSAAPDGKHIFVSSMGDGTVKMIRVAEDGKMTLTDERQLTGHSVTPRQNQAKVHSVMVSPNGKWLAAANLGADEVELFRVDHETETLRLADSKGIDFGREPRHMAFHPSGDYLYVLTEGGNRLYVFTVHQGKLRELAAYETRQETGEQKGAAADIVVSRDGKRIYTSNRGQNNIAVWRVLASGLLDLAGHCACGGQGPRGLCLSPDGSTLYAANYDSGTVTSLPIDQETGLLRPAGQALSVPAAGCVRVK